MTQYKLTFSQDQQRHVKRVKPSSIVFKYNLFQAQINTLTQFLDRIDPWMPKKGMFDWFDL